MTLARKDHLDRLAIGLLLACCGFWGFQQILIKSTVGEVPAMWQATIRFVIATALLLAWCTWRRVALFKRDGTLGAGLLVGALFAAEFCCIYLGLQYTSASRLTVFLYTSPFVVALLLPRFSPSETLRRVQWVGLTIAFAAVAYAFSEGFERTTLRQLRGDALGLAAGVLWGLTTLAIRGSKDGALQRREDAVLPGGRDQRWWLRCCRWRWAKPGRCSIPPRPGRPLDFRPP
jgi:drug/metabolite transporter (DMT)-like permease